MHTFPLFYVLFNLEHDFPFHIFIVKMLGYGHIIFVYRIIYIGSLHPSHIRSNSHFFKDIKIKILSHGNIFLLFNTFLLGNIKIGLYLHAYCKFLWNTNILLWLLFNNLYLLYCHFFTDIDLLC